MRKRDAIDPQVLPEFADPPVIEVALAVAFQPILGLNTVALGDLWRKTFSKAFPRTEEQQPIQPAVESFGPTPGGLSLSFELGRSLPLPRLWFLNVEGNELVQVQNNWFARNWRRMSAEAEYPRYPSLRAPFERDLRAFEAFIVSKRLGELRPTSVEITYTNHIEVNSDDKAAGLERVLSLVDDRPPEFLPAPESARFAAQYRITGDDGTPIGRLYLSGEPAIRRSDGVPISVLTVTGRGNPLGDGIDGVMEFLDIAHRWVVQGFAAATRPSMHEVWGRIDGN